MCAADITPLTYLNCKHVPFTVSRTVAGMESEKRPNSCHPRSRGGRGGGGTLDSPFPVVFRNGFFRDGAGALISDNEPLPSVFN